jgi:UDP-2,4-diacetamido-2,4,6-trideoxy-beta-L-altropyranose hydrolase
MKVVFRADASLQIGTGHVMRCITLANALRDVGAECIFICREHPGNMLDFIRVQGFEAIGLPMSPANTKETEDEALAHAEWLGVHWKADVKQTKIALEGAVADWCVLDHYALDAKWEQALHPSYNKLLVIDDLADRAHECDLLLDQNLVANMNGRYKGQIPNSCVSLLGPEYALLRPEFGEKREESLARRAQPKADQLLIFLGGSDPENETLKVVEALLIAKKTWKRIDVVVGESYPHLEKLREKLGCLSNAVLHVQTADMAGLMLHADLAFTAGGSTSWEKCCLGVPSLVVIQGQNQSEIAAELHLLGAQKTLGWGSNLSARDYAESLDAVAEDDLVSMTAAASRICDGTGTQKIIEQMRAQL